jgi:hypothetical protein
VKITAAGFRNVAWASDGDQRKVLSRSAYNRLAFLDEQYFSQLQIFSPTEAPKLLLLYSLFRVVVHNDDPMIIAISEPLIQAVIDAFVSPAIFSGHRH